jgi:hypothetical protein
MPVNLKNRWKGQSPQTKVDIPVTVNEVTTLLDEELKAEKMVREYEETSWFPRTSRQPTKTFMTIFVAILAGHAAIGTLTFFYLAKQIDMGYMGR